jgi:hypothetical protein
MNSKWVLVTVLDGNRNRTVWNTQEGAIADRERQLAPRRIKDRESPTGWRTIWPNGWTSIGRQREDA